MRGSKNIVNLDNYLFLGRNLEETIVAYFKVQFNIVLQDRRTAWKFSVYMYRTNAKLKRCR
jgi:hypothetical protein